MGGREGHGQCCSSQFLAAVGVHIALSWRGEEHRAALPAPAAPRQSSGLKALAKAA